MRPIPFIDLAAQQARIRPEIERRIRGVLDHGQYIMGPEVAELERGLAVFTGAKHAIAVSSGTDALLVAVMALGIGRGDAVFVPAFTFPATAEAIVVAGATPIFVDVDEATANMDPADLAKRAEQAAKAGNLKLRAVMPVDLYGLPADYAAIRAVAAKYGMKVIADAAQSFGGALGGRRVGLLADVTCTSFFPAKPLGAYGDGGAVFTDDDELAAVMKSIRVHGQGGGKYDIVRLGLNARIDTLQAAILLPKLEIFGDEIAKRQAVADGFAAHLPGVDIPRVPSGYQCAWAQYTIRVDRRDDVAARLKGQGVPTAVYYPKAMHHQAAYRPNAPAQPLTVSDRLAERVLSLPMHPYLDAELITYIGKAVVGAVAGR